MKRVTFLAVVFVVAAVAEASDPMKRVAFLVVVAETSGDDITAKSQESNGGILSLQQSIGTSVRNES